MFHPLILNDRRFFNIFVYHLGLCDLWFLDDFEPINYFFQEIRTTFHKKIQDDCRFYFIYEKDSWFTT